VPSLKLHRKYGELLGIDENVQKEVDRFIDSRRHHDFYDKFIKKSEFKFTYMKLIINNFDFRAFAESEYMKEIEKYGYDGIRCFFLHIFLDYIERHLRAKRNIDFRNPIRFLVDNNEFEKFFDGIDKQDLYLYLRSVRTKETPRIVCLIMNVAGELYRKSFENVRSFINQHYYEIAEDIKDEQDLKGATIKAQRNLRKAQEIASQINKIRSSLFAGMRWIGYNHYMLDKCPYNPYFYYLSVIKYEGIDGLLKELKYNNHYDLLIRNILTNFEDIVDKSHLFPKLKEFVKKYKAQDIINNENLLKEFLKIIFK